MEVLVSVRHETWKHSLSVCSGSGKERDSSRPFAMEGFTCLYSIYEEGSHILTLQSNWTTEILN